MISWKILQPLKSTLIKESVAGSVKEGIKRKNNSVEWQTLMCLAFGPKTAIFLKWSWGISSQTRSL